MHSECAVVRPGAVRGKALLISYFATNSQAAVSLPQIIARCRRTSDSEALAKVVEEKRVNPAGAHDGINCEIAIELTTGPRFKPSTRNIATPVDLEFTE
jgi:hypothetical protein